jgi:hypothetical protein
MEAMSKGPAGNRKITRAIAAKGLRLLFWILADAFELRDLERIGTSVGIPINHRLVLTKEPTNA